MNFLCPPPDIWQVRPARTGAEGENASVPIKRAACLIMTGTLFVCCGVVIAGTAVAMSLSRIF